LIRTDGLPNSGRYRQRAAAISYVKAEIICGEGAMIEVARFEDKTV
jgi:hypothetical protein